MSEIQCIQSYDAFKTTECHEYKATINCNFDSTLHLSRVFVKTNVFSTTDSCIERIIDCNAVFRFLIIETK